MCEILSSFYEVFSSFDDGVLQKKIEIVATFLMYFIEAHHIKKAPHEVTSTLTQFSFLAFEIIFLASICDMIHTASVHCSFKPL